MMMNLFGGGDVDERGSVGSSLDETENLGDDCVEVRGAFVPGLIMMMFSA